MKAIACNISTDEKPFPRHALAYVVRVADGGDKIKVIARNRGGELIQRTVDADKLTNFRWKEITPDHKFFGIVKTVEDGAVADEGSESFLRLMQ